MSIVFNGTLNEVQKKENYWEVSLFNNIQFIQTRDIETKVDSLDELFDKINFNEFERYTIQKK